MTIDQYLAELEQRLPRIARRRAVAEAQEHLRDSRRGIVRLGFRLTKPRLRR